MRLQTVVLPEPEGPTSARTSPGATSRSIPLRTFRSGPYPKVTSANEIRPAARGSAGAGTGSTMVGTVSRISKTRWMAPVPWRNWPYVPAMLPEVRRDRDAVQEEAHERPDGQGAVDDLAARVPEEDGDRAEPEEAHDSPEDPPPQGQPRRRGDDPPEVGVVALQLPVLANEALDDTDPREGFLGRRRALRDLVLHLGADPLQGPAEEHRDDDERRRQDQDDDQERRRQDEEDDDRADEADGRRQQVRDGLGQHGPDLGHVAREARDELPQAPLAVEVEGERHEAREELRSQPGHDALTDDAQEVGLDERPERHHDEQDHEDHDEAVQAGRVAAGDDLGRDAGDEEREQQPQAGRHEEAGDGQGEQEQVGSEVAEQAPPWNAREALDLADHLAGLGGDARQLLRHPRTLRHRPDPAPDPGASRRRITLVGGVVAAVQRRRGRGPKLPVCPGTTGEPLPRASPVVRLPVAAPGGVRAPAARTDPGARRVGRPSARPDRPSRARGRGPPRGPVPAR